jgi:thymidylate synthase (FAD)
VPRMWMGDEPELVQYVDHMGDDDAVCDAARVSMAKTSDLFTINQNHRLIAYLAKHNHWSPFSHCQVKFRFKAPIFVARQLQKHQVGFSWNEVSRRYVNEEPEFWMPLNLRPKADNVKQGSSDAVHPASDLYKLDLDNMYHYATSVYSQMVAEGICAEQARAVLPQAMMTEWIWTGSLYAWARMHALRSESHAQREVQFYASRIDEEMTRLFPISWSALKDV